MMQLQNFSLGQKCLPLVHNHSSTRKVGCAHKIQPITHRGKQKYANTAGTAIHALQCSLHEQSNDEAHRKKRRRSHGRHSRTIPCAKVIEDDDDDFPIGDVPEEFGNEDEDEPGTSKASIEEEDDDISPIDSLDAAADAEAEDEEEATPARRRSNPKLMLDEDEGDEAIDEADPEDEVDPDADTDIVPSAELDDDLDLDSIIDAAVPPAARSSAAARLPSLEAEDEDDEDYEDEEDEEEEELPGPSYPEPPERSYALGDLLEMSGYGLTQRSVSNVRISGLCADPYKVQPGDLYITLWDSIPEEWINEAIENGAAAFLGPETDRASSSESSSLSIPVIQLPDPWEALGRLGAAFYNEPSQKMTVVGITGSAGKTTTAWLIRGIFEEWGKLTGMAGTIENAIYADKLDADGNLWTPNEPDPTLDRDCSAAFHLAPYQGKYPAPHAAPDPLEMQKLLAGMADRGADVAVVECESEGLAVGRMDEVDMDIVVYINLTTEAIEASGQSVEAMLEAQARLLRRLTDPSRQRAIINIDDPHADEMRSYAAHVPVVTFAMYNKAADVYADKMRFSLWETEVIVKTPVGSLQIITPLIARHNVYNILAAVAVGLAVTVDGEPIPLKTIVQGIEATEIIPGRCEVIDEDQPFGCVVDAADTPGALSRLMDGLQECRPKRLILVLGCPGEAQEEKRPFMGEIAHYKADMVIMTNDSPMGEPPNEIIADMVAGYPDRILKRNASVPYQPGFLQDPGRVDFDALEFLWHNCYEYSRYVIEDRWEAIRWAIGSAQTDDCVVIVGRGHKDYVDWRFGDEIARGWFDDRVESRNALAKVSKLWQISGFDRAELPWMDAGDREGRLFNKAEV